MRLCLFLPYIRNKRRPQLIHLVIIIATYLVMCAQLGVHVNALHIYQSLFGCIVPATCCPINILCLVLLLYNESY